jgi:L-threonylcarbamoyladenylate synthase
LRKLCDNPATILFCDNSVTTAFLNAATDLDRAAALLRDGELVAFPTETVYGLGARVFSADAVRKVFEAKGRPQDNPLIVHCASKRDVERVARDIPPVFWRLYEHLCPGALTVLLPRQPSVPDAVTAGLETVAVRIPNHPAALELIRRVGEPLVAPSANRSGYVSPTSAAHVLHDLAGRIAAVLDGGECMVGIESTVIDILQKPHQILRPGTITAAQIASTLGVDASMIASMVANVIASSGAETRTDTSAEAVSVPASPGMKYRHYAPAASVVLAATSHEAHGIIMNWLQSSTSAVWLLCVDAVSERERFVSQSYDRSGKERVRIETLDAQHFYATLRKADAERVGRIVILCDAAALAQEGLMNRVRKAAEG